MQSIFQKLGEWLEELFKFLASLKLAVIIILSLGVVSAIGTIVEARFDAVYAQKTVYHSPWMYAIMALLCVNLINVMIDRLPWKRHHAGFIFAHVGIIVLIAGSLVTKIYGVDGSMSLDIDSKSRVVMLPDTDFFVASSLGGEYRTIYNSPVDFITRPPNKTDYTFPLGDINLKVLQYYHFAVRDEKIMPSESLFDGPAIRFQLENDNVNVTDWILKSGANPFEVFELGPAKVILTSETTDIGPIVGNTLVLRTQGGPTDLPPDKISYEVFT